MSQDGGMPVLSENYNASDNKIFKERSATPLEELAVPMEPRYLLVDYKLYMEENAANLPHLPFINYADS